MMICLIFSLTILIFHPSPPKSTSVLTSAPFQGYFEENPTDLAALRRDKALHTVKIQQHLAHVPEYLLPAALRNEETEEKETEAAPVIKKRKNNANYGSAKRHKYQVRYCIIAIIQYTFYVPQEIQFLIHDTKKT